MPPKVMLADGIMSYVGRTAYWRDGIPVRVTTLNHARIYSTPEAAKAAWAFDLMQRRASEVEAKEYAEERIAQIDAELAAMGVEPAALAGGD